jgi:hypothetical protein
MKKFITSILEQDMAHQARLVEIITLVMFVVLIFVAWSFWQFQINITVPGPEGQRIVVEQMNIFELLLSKK